MRYSTGALTATSGTGVGHMVMFTMWLALSLGAGLRQPQDRRQTGAQHATHDTPDIPQNTRSSPGQSDRKQRPQHRPARAAHATMRLFKNARSLRFCEAWKSVCGGRRARNYGSYIRNHCRVRGECTCGLLDFAATTHKKLEGYRTGWGLSDVKARDRIIALGMMRQRRREDR